MDREGESNREGLGVISVLLFAALVLSPLQVVEVRYSFVSPQTCAMADNGGADEDWVVYRCAGEGGVPVWLTYFDGTKMRVSFGQEQTDDSAFFGSDRDPRWPIEWRGTASPRFEPYAAIVRMRPPPGLDDERSQLVVYRVEPGRASSIIGYASSNEEAQRMADRNRGASR